MNKTFSRRKIKIPILRAAFEKWPTGIITLSLLFAMAVNACSIGPDYTRPETTLPASWLQQADEVPTRAVHEDEVMLSNWWTIFNDPQLTALIAEAIESNLDILKAEARIRQAMASRRYAIGGFGPSIDADASYRRNRIPESPAGDRGSSESGTYQAGFDAGWELDIFGRQRRAVEVAEADLQAAEENRRDILVSLTAEVAANYITLGLLQERLGITSRTLETQKQTVSLSRELFDVGFASRLDVVRGESQAAATSAQLPKIEEAAQQSIYNLSLLLGKEPGALLPALLKSKISIDDPPSIPFGVPSDLLRRRPDIRRAEAELHASTARIGIAVADLFPRLTLSGSLGLQADDFSSTFNWANRFWSYGPSISWRVFETGRTLSNIEIQKALQEEQVIGYRQTVLKALQEVEQSLIALSKEREHNSALQSAVASSQEAVELATLLYRQGQTDFLPVLDAQRSLYALEDSLAQSTGTVLLNLVSLYKTLGGGWNSEKP